MYPLTNHYALLPYYLQQLEQERRIAQRRHALALARRARRGQTIRSGANPVARLVHTAPSAPSDESGLPRAA